MFVKRFLEKWVYPDKIVYGGISTPSQRNILSKALRKFYVAPYLF